MKKLNEMTLNELLFELKDVHHYNYVDDIVNIKVFSKFKTDSRLICEVYDPKFMGEYLLEQTIRSYNIALDYKDSFDNMHVELKICINI